MPHRSRYMFITLFAVAFGVFPACARQRDAAIGNQVVAGDFAISLYVAGPPTDPEPMRRRSQYVIQPDRILRLAVGHSALAITLPRPYRRLSHAEFEALYDIVHRNHLLAEPTSPSGAAHQPGDEQVVYIVEITAGGRTNRFRTTAAESPPTAALLAQLVKLIDKETWQ